MIPERLIDWLGSENRALQDTASGFSDTMELVEQTHRTYSRILKSIRNIHHDDYRQVIMTLFFSFHKLMLTVFSLVLRRHVPQCYPLIRTMLEHAADVNKIRHKPELAYVWLNKEENEGEFVTSFTKPRFPKGDPVTGRLFEPWKIVSEYGSHSNIGSVANAVLFERREDGQITGFRFKYFLHDDVDLRRVLIWFLVNIPKMSNPFLFGLRPLLRDDACSLVNLLEEKIWFHRDKYREILLPKSGG